MQTLIYARFSSVLQNARSIEDQVALCTERCRREGWTVAGVFTDHAISGAAGIDESQRPGLNALLERVETVDHPDGPIDQVLAEATDRIARHQGDAHAIRERLTFAGARIFTLSDGEVTEITATFRGLMDAQFRKDLASKVRRGQKGAVASGRHANGIAYGYRRANRIDDKGEIIRGLREVHEEQADIVRRIFRDYAAGLSPRSIAAALNDEGVPPPQARSGKHSFWRASTIYGDRKRQNGILQNRAYIGQLVYGRTRKVTDPRTRKPKIVANPESEWQVVEAPELRIVTDEDWRAVQKVLGHIRAKKPHDARRPKHLLSGLGRCGACGGAIIVRGTARWGCSRRLEGGEAACSNGRTITGTEYERRVLGGLRDKLLDPGLVEIYVREYHREFARRAAESQGSEARLRKRHEDASAKVSRLVAAIAEGGGEFAEVREALKAAKADQAKAARELENVERLPVVALHPHIAKDYREQVERLNKALAENPEARLEAIPKLRSLIDTIVLTPRPEGQRGLDIVVTGGSPPCSNSRPARNWRPRCMVAMERARRFERPTPTLATANWYFRYRLRFQ